MLFLRRGVSVDPGCNQFLCGLLLLLRDRRVKSMAQVQLLLAIKSSGFAAFGGGARD